MKKERQTAIIEVIQSHEVRNQQQLLEELEKRGLQTNQSSISRDLTELGVFKVNGNYRLPHISQGESPFVDLLKIDKAGDNLIVLQTEAGQAPIVALMIDRAKLKEVVGTIAGDDTIFVAVKDGQHQTKAMKEIFHLFQRCKPN